MPAFLHLLALLAIAVTVAAEAPPPPDAAQVPPAAPSDTPASPAPPAPPAVTTPADDQDIRARFAGKAACPPGEPPVGVGPWEFHEGGDYVRQQDLTTAHGRYAVVNGKICVTLAHSDKVDFCLAVLKRGDRYLFRLDDSQTLASQRDPVPVAPCPLPP